MKLVPVFTDYILLYEHLVNLDYGRQFNALYTHYYMGVGTKAYAGHFWHRRRS